MSSFAYTYNTLNKEKAYKLAEKYNLEGKDTDVTKVRKEISLYRMYIKDNKNIRHFRFNRTKRRILNKELYFLVFSSIKERDFKFKYARFRKQGIPASAIYRIVSKKMFTLYSVQINESADDQYDIEKNLSLAQSRIRFGPNISNANQFSSYIELLTGIENTSDTENFKLTGRYEQFSETSRVGEYNISRLELDEAYLNFTYSKSSLTLGKQLFSWGVFDEFSVVDRVNIKNAPRFIFDTGEFYRRPITALRYEEYFNQFKLDMFIDSGAEEGKFLSSGSLWTGIDQVEGQLRGVPQDEVPAALIKNLTVHSKPRKNISHGIRFSYNSDFDAAISYLKAYTDLPVITISRELQAQLLTNSVTSAGLSAGIELEYVQEDVLAIDFSKQIGDSLYKFEYSYIPNSPLLLTNFGIKREKRQRFAFGADMDFNIANSSINWQYVSDQFLTDEETLVFSELNQFILHTESLFFRDKLSTGIDSIIFLKNSSFSLRPYMDYILSDTDNIGISYYMFSGDPDTFFGYHANDNLILAQYQKSF